MLIEIFKETLIRVAGIAAIILPLLLLVEYLNHQYGDKLIIFLEKRKRFMPAWAALLAMLPGCNAAAAVAVLYAKGMVSMGALVSAMIATSDEAIYVFIPSRFNFLPLFSAKFIVAVLAGIIIDLIFATKMAIKNQKVAEIGYCCSVHHHDHDHKLPGMIKHTLKHGIKIIGFVFVTLFLFNYVQDTYGIGKISNLIGETGIFQPAFAALFGLIPGCGTSVVMATLYVKGILTFGGAVAGLSATSGDAVLVLIGNKIGLKRTVVIVTAVFTASVMAGYVINWFI